MMSATTKLLRNFVKSFDEEYTVRKAKSFDSSIFELTISYTLTDADPMGEAFRADFINRFPACADFSLFLLSFMHELGHLETEYDMVNDTAQRNKVKSARAYFRLHNEKIATDWAGNYLTAHHDEMKNFEKKFWKTLDK